MLEPINFSGGGKLFSSILEESVRLNLSSLPKAGELTPYKRAFSDRELVKTCFCLFENDLNVSQTANRLYMHRNTLIYRIKKMKKLTGLDVCKFGDAVTFIILYNSYAKEQKK